MVEQIASDIANTRVKQALQLWGAFIALAVVINGTIPFALGVDMRAWTDSLLKHVLFISVIYAGLFLAVTLVLVKGWATVRQPGFLVPLLVAVLGIVLWSTVARLAAVLVVAALIYLHRRFDLSDIGFRSCGWRGDLGAILLMGLLSFAPLFFQPDPYSFTPGKALLASLDRLFANPASTAENLFYFGFLAERLSYKTGKWLTPLLVGAMYTAHEMSNPEYWYKGMAFMMVFVAVTLSTAIYLWRRSVAVIWLGDGLSRFISWLF